MTNPLFLVAHKHNGEARMEVASQMTCPECHGEGCIECDESGHWWITSSGHRPYAYWSQPLDMAIPEPPEGWRNSYESSARPKAKAPSLADLGFVFTPKPLNIRRRV
jgi:hypothetical protein